MFQASKWNDSSKQLKIKLNEENVSTRLLFYVFFLKFHKIKL